MDITQIEYLNPNPSRNPIKIGEIATMAGEQVIHHQNSGPKRIKATNQIGSDKPEPTGYQNVSIVPINRLLRC